MRRLWFTLLFLGGGIAHELRNPVGCQCIAARDVAAAAAARRQAGRR